MNKNQQTTINMLLTTIVNNENVFDMVVADMENRFKTKIDKTKLQAFLNVVEVEVKNEPVFV